MFTGRRGRLGPVVICRRDARDHKTILTKETTAMKQVLTRATRMALFSGLLGLTSMAQAYDPL